MKITLNLDESLLSEALHLTNLDGKDDLIKLALQELVGHSISLDTTCYTVNGLPL
jgi:Arc/MetJ family transcription regulator